MFDFLFGAVVLCFFVAVVISLLFFVAVKLGAFPGAKND